MVVLVTLSVPFPPTLPTNRKPEHLSTHVHNAALCPFPITRSAPKSPIRSFLSTMVGRSSMDTLPVRLPYCPSWRSVFCTSWPSCASSCTVPPHLPCPSISIGRSVRGRPYRYPPARATIGGSPACPVHSCTPGVKRFLACTLLRTFVRRSFVRIS